MPPTALDLWAQLLREHGPLLPARTFTASALAHAIEQGRVFWVEAISDGYGSGDVSFRRVTAGERVMLAVADGRHRHAFAFRAETFDPTPWLETLSHNPWERLGEVPSLFGSWLSLAELDARRERHRAWLARGQRGEGRFALGGDTVSGGPYAHWQLASARFEGSFLGSLLLHGANVRDAHFVGVSLNNARLSTLAANGARWTRCEAQRVEIIAGDLSGARLSDCDLFRASLKKSRLIRTAFERTSMVEADFADARWSRTSFVDCDLRRARFTSAQAGDDDFTGVLDDVRFTRCDLRGASFHGARLARVTFDQCRLGAIHERPTVASETTLLACDGSDEADGSAMLTGAAELLAWPAPAPLPPVATRSAARAAWETERAQRLQIDAPSCAESVLWTLARDGSEGIREAIAGGSNVPMALCEQLARDASWRVRACLAARASPPTQACELLVRDEDPGVRWALATNATTPLATLTRLAGDAQWRVRESVARNPSTPSETLQILGQDASVHVRAAVASSPYTPLDVLRTLAWRTGAVRTDDLLGAALAGNRSTPVETLRALLAHGSDFVVERVLSNPNAPPEHVEAVAIGPRRVHVAGHAALSPTRVAHMAIDADHGVRRVIAAREDIAAKLLATLANDVRAEVRAAVARNPRATPRIIARLSRDPDASVRATVAGRDALSTATRRALAEDPDDHVRWSLARGPSVSASLLRAFADEHGTRAGVALNPRTAGALLARLARAYEVHTRASVARNPSASFPVLEALSRDPSARVRAAVAENVNTPTPLLEGLALDPIAAVRSAVGANSRTPRVSLLALARDLEAVVRRGVESNPCAPFAIRRDLALPSED